MSRSLTYAQAITEATAIAMEQDPRMIAFGLGVDDPKRIFGTTSGLAERFGPERVFDMPTSEAAMRQGTRREGRESAGFLGGRSLPSR